MGFRLSGWSDSHGIHCSGLELSSHGYGSPLLTLPCLPDSKFSVVRLYYMREGGGKIKSQFMDKLADATGIRKSSYIPV